MGRMKYRCLAALKHVWVFPVFFLLILFRSFAEPASEALQQWPQWRGPLGTGVAPQADPPRTWSETSHIKWKQPITGFGTSTPIIWGQRVFILSAAPVEGDDAATAGSGKAWKFLVLCYDRESGKLLWEKVACEKAPHQGHHADHGYASASPVTDGEHVFAYFGSRGLHAYDLEGNLVWSKDFGPLQTKNGFGEGSSAALFGDTLVIYRDDETDQDCIIGLDKLSGKERWRTPRNNESTGWSTPLIVQFEGQAQVVVNATGRVRSYDLLTGKQIWECGGQTPNTIPMPVASADTVFVTSGYRASVLQAIALGRTGDLTGSDAIRWKYDKQTPYVPSPLLVDDLIYFVAINNPVLSCLDARTGKPHYAGQRLEELTGIYASAVSARDRVYILGRNGTCLVIKKGASFEILATNKLEDKTDASLALVGSDLFVRGHKFLYCISGE
jgi:outer membrane protein assembly factor BamB